MAIISPEDRETLQRLFAEKLQDDITIISFTQHYQVHGAPKTVVNDRVEFVAHSRSHR